MSKKPKNNRQFGLPTEAVVERIEPPTYPVVPNAKPKKYSAPPCSGCTAMRPAGTNFTRANGTETKTNTATELIIARACKCHYCGNTWTDYERIKHAKAD